MFLHVSVSLFKGDLPHCMLGYTLPRTRGRHPSGPGTPPEQTIPPAWEIRATSGRYASYWNAILLVFTQKSLMYSREMYSTLVRKIKEGLMVKYKTKTKQFHAVFGKIRQNLYVAPPLGWHPLLRGILYPPPCFGLSIDL